MYSCNKENKLITGFDYNVPIKYVIFMVLILMPLTTGESQQVRYQNKTQFHEKTDKSFNHFISLNDFKNCV